MDQQISNTEQQVWQRVFSCREEGPKQDLRQLQQEALELAAAYRSLSSRLAGRARELTKRLGAGESANAATLAGIGKLSRAGEEALKFWQPGTEEPRKLLQRCYHRTRRNMTEYLARSADGEFGVVFDRLAKRSAEHCALIAEVLGRLP